MSWISSKRKQAVSVETVGEGTSPKVAVTERKTRIRKSRRKRIGTAAQARNPSLRVVSRHEERPEHIPHHLAWYYRKDTRPAGPYTLEEVVAMLADGQLGEENLVWSESVMDDWMPVRDVPLLHQMLDLDSEED